MRTPDPLEELALLVRSNHGLAVLDTDDEDRASTLLRHLADRLGTPRLAWTATHGLRRDDADGPVYGTQSPQAALAHVERAAFPAVYHFRGLGPFLGDPGVSAALADAARACEVIPGIIILTGSGLSLPEPVRLRAAVVRLAPPEDADYHELLGRILRDLRQRQDVAVELKPDELRRLYANLRGLTLIEAQKALTRAIVEDGRLSADDIAAVLERKRELVERDGLLEYYPVEEALADVADLAGLKGWLEKRSALIRDPQRARGFGLEFPKGILLVGVPGAGKSLCAKAVASEWMLPLLKLDPSALYNKYIGETERNFRRAMETAERMAPVVLWIDELEKAFAEGGSEDGGVSTRVLGTFLGWMQDRRADVFVVATANDVQRLPPEFLRKGRFDEVFFVDFPDAAGRCDIFRIHLARRNHEPADFDLDALADAAPSFTGAEIEQVIISALYTAFASGKPLSQGALLAEIARTRPLASTARERIGALRAWAHGRTVPAN